MFKTTNEHLENEINALEGAFPSYSFHTGKLGQREIGGDYVGPFWGSIFVTNAEDIQIGRILYSDGKFSHTKAYGENKGFDIDDFWWALRFLLAHGKLIKDFDQIKQACSWIQKTELEYRKENCKQFKLGKNPKGEIIKKRIKRHPRNWNDIVANFLRLAETCALAPFVKEAQNKFPMELI